MQKVAKSPLYLMLSLSSVFLATTSARAEKVILACKSPPEANTCPSHWVIDGNSKMVTWRWCKSKDSTEQRNVVMTSERITFDEDFMARHYDFDRKSGRLTMTAAGSDGVRFDDGFSICKAAATR